MNRFKWFLLGVVSLGIVELAIGGIFVLNAHGFSASEQPSSVERWLARSARSAALPSGARALRNPVPNNPEALAEARAHWADHCAACHANDGSGDTLLGKRTYPAAPDMRLPATQQMSDGELFYVIQNGIRLSAMPTWSGGSDHDAQDSWKLVHFIRYLPQLTVEEKKEMEGLNPKSPGEFREEEEEKKFLEGADTNEQEAQHHHH
ncbi:MAG: c-type cytochrome [Bryobacteraceae bacterium]